MGMKAKEIVIKGKVHNVGYRFLLLSEAERWLIEKFDARNVLVKGEQHLIVLVEGVEEKISRFVEFVESSYPPEASVESVGVKDYKEEVRSIDAFRQSFMVFQLTKMAQAGVGMLGKQDAMLEKQDKTIEILESMKGDTSKMLEKQDDTIKVIKEESEKTREVTRAEGEKSREVVEKVREAVREESEKTREVMKEKIGEDVEWIKEEIILWGSRQLSAR